MRKLLFLFFLLFFNKILASSVGNIASPAIVEEGFIISDKTWLNFRFGYENYTVEDLEMKFKDAYRKQSFSVRAIKAFSNTGLMTINIKERLDAYVYLGSFRIEPEIKYFSTLYKSKSENDLLLKSGGKLVLFEIGDFTLGVDAKYSIFSAKSDLLTRNDVPINNENLKYSFKEWQIGVGLGLKITIFRPYIGIAYRDTRIRIKNAPYFNDQNLLLKFEKKAGGFLGTSASMGSYVMLNAEIRYVNEKSVSVSGMLRF